MIYIAVYLAILIGIGIYDYFRTKNFDDYVVAGRKQPLAPVTFSLLATIIGGSASVGLIERADSMGTPAMWWLFVGAAGLILQSMFLSKRIKRFEAYTLPDIAEKIIGKPTRVLVALIIVSAWIGIVAAQFLAAGRLISVLLPSANATLIMTATACVMILYAVLGGQMSILKTDFIQFIVLGFAVIFTFIVLFFTDAGGGVTVSQALSVGGGLLTDDFKAYDLIYLFFILGGSYFIGPDMFSRAFTAKDGKTASRAAFISGVALIAFSFLITGIGLWAKSALVIGEADDIIRKIFEALPKAGGITFVFGLLSAVISSADTLLVTTGAIIENDILGKRNTLITRVFAGLVGVVGLIIALKSTNIMLLLLKALSVYTPGIVLPLFVAIMVHGKRKPNQALMFTAMALGGSLGLAGSLLNTDYLSLIGMGLSGVFAGLSVFKPTNN